MLIFVLLDVLYIEIYKNIFIRESVRRTTLIIQTYIALLAGILLVSYLRSGSKLSSVKSSMLIVVVLLKLVCKRNEMKFYYMKSIFNKRGC